MRAGPARSAGLAGVVARQRPAELYVVDVVRLQKVHADQEEDDVGTLAQLKRARGITSDGTSVYWAGYESMTVRQAEVATARVTTLAGTADVCGDLPGVGTAAELEQPFGIVYHFPTNSLYVSSGNGSICSSLTPRIWRIE